MIKKEKINVYDMTCGSCEKRVEGAVSRVDGVITAKANYSGQFAEIEYDDAVCSHNNINKAINDAGYGTNKKSDFKFYGMVAIVAAVLILGFNTAGFDMESRLNNASYAVLFIAGLLTSIHCVGMCGGIMLSQTVNNESDNKLQAMMPALYYNAGRVISYTVLGAIMGAVGSVFSLSFKSIISFIPLNKSPVKLGLIFFFKSSSFNALASELLILLFFSFDSKSFISSFLLFIISPLAIVLTKIFKSIH